ncbi:hypothetical protein HDU97_003148 [Phlyctochytrium planicorne]|nr:hypothetical protein HDU97_003148 [Phlyctochytrium planicorne]
MSSSSEAILVKTSAPAAMPTMSTDGIPEPKVVPKIQRSFAHQIDLPSTGDGLSDCYQSCVSSCGTLLGYMGMLPCCCCCNPFSQVQQGYVGLISRFGRYYRSLNYPKSVDPGLWRINPLSETIRQVEIKIQIEDIPRQVVMSRDNVLISIDSVLFWEIVEPYTATFLVADVRKAIIERTQTTLRHIIGTRTLQECIENRDSIAHEIQEIIEEPATAWGIKIESMLIKDFQFSQELQETLSAAAKQKRIGESKVILAAAEVQSAKLMREASDILNTPAAMQIRYLETLSTMSKNAGTKVIFMPTNQGTGSNVGGTSSVIQAQVLENYDEGRR